MTTSAVFLRALAPRQGQHTVHSRKLPTNYVVFLRALARQRQHTVYSSKLEK